MQQLSAVDQARCAAAAVRLLAATDMPSYRATALSVVADAVGADSVGFNEVDLLSGRLAAVWFSDPAVDPADTAVNVHLAHHPVMAFHARFGDGRALAISDLVTQRAWQSNPLYREVLRHVETEDQLSAAFSPSPGVRVGIAVNRSTFGFSERDRSVLDAIVPVLAAAYSGAMARSVWSATFHGLPALPGSGDVGLVVLGAADVVVDVNEAAHDLLVAAGIPVRLGERLGGLLAAGTKALRSASGPRVLHLESRNLHVAAALTLDGGEPTVLAVRADNRLSASLARLPLTPRQMDVLRLAADGLSTREIAQRLAITSATVEKHFERIHAALGVRTRAQALARLLSDLNSSVRMPAADRHAPAPDRAHCAITATRRRPQ